MKAFFLCFLFPLAALGQIAISGNVLVSGNTSLSAPTPGQVDWITIDTNGFAATVHFAQLATGGTYAYGLGTSNALTGTEKLRISVVSPGYDDTGASNAFPRTVVGTMRMRQAFPNQALAYETQDATGVKVRFALSDYIHTNDTITSISIASGLLTQGGVVSKAATFASCTNLSWAVAPRVLAMWSQPDYFLSGGVNYKVSLVAFQYSGQQKRPVRAVKFWSMDAAGNKSPTNIVLNPVIDITQTDAVPVIEFTNNVDCSGMVQGSVISNYAIVYPWWGPALDLSDNVNPPGSADYCPSITLCDKNQVWRGAYAVVDPGGNDTTGKALTNVVTQPTGGESAFLTIARALDACAGTNNTFNGSNTLGNCTVFVNPGTYDVFGGNFASYGHPLSWTTIRGNPTLNWSNVFFATANNSLTGQKDLKLRVQNVVCRVTAFANTFGQGYGDILIDNCLIQTNTQSSVSVASSFTNLWLRQNVVSGMRNFPNAVQGNQVGSWVKCRGNNFAQFDTMLDGRNIVINPLLLIGNSFLAYNWTNEQYTVVNDSGGAIYDPFIWAFNKFMNGDEGVYQVEWGINAILTKGGAFVQNVVESRKGPGASVPLDSMFSDRDNEWCTNNLIWNNTILGKYHMPFNLSGRTTVSADHVQHANNVWTSWELTSDVGNANGAATNRWALTYQVGSFNNASTVIGSTLANPAGNELGFDGPSSWYDGTTNSISFKFLSNGSWCGGNTNGNGDYHLTAASPIVNSYLTGAVMLPYDIEGQPRAATNAPGAYAIVH